MTSTTLWTSIDTVAHPLFGVTMLLPTLGSYATSSRKIYSHNFADVARGVVFILLLQSVMAGAKPNPIIQLTLHAVWLGLSHKPHIPGFILFILLLCRFRLYMPIWTPTGLQPQFRTCSSDPLDRLHHHGVPWT